MTSANNKLTYDKTRVCYDDMDPFQEECLEAARETRGNIERLGVSLVPGTSLIDIGDAYIDHVEEGLGTLSHVARALEQRHGLNFFRSVGYGAASAAINDVLRSGALPMSYQVDISAGDSKWFTATERRTAIKIGWRDACMDALCAWTGGETAALPDLIYPDQVVLSGSVVGIIKPKDRRIMGNIEQGDSIVVLRSSGYHINAVSMYREIAKADPSFYDLHLPGGQTTGEAMMTPTFIYRDVIETCLDRGIELHAANVISGHGWRKLAYLGHLPLTYVVEHLPEPHPIFRAVIKQGNIDEEEAFLQMNMGAGAAFFVPRDQVVAVLQAANDVGKEAELVGYVTASDDGMRHIHLLPKDFHWVLTTKSVPM